MKTPFDDEIAELRKAILELEGMDDYNALMMAKNDLYRVVKTREEWIKDNIK